MKFEPFAPCARDAFLENLAVELTEAAYKVAIRHKARDVSLDLQLEFWEALTQVIARALLL